MTGLSLVGLLGVALLKDTLNRKTQNGLLNGWVRMQHSDDRTSPDACG